jgi:hypothetical protein
VRFVFPALALLLVPTVAQASTYVAFDVGLAHRTGAWKYDGPAGLSGPGIELDRSMGGTGVLSHFAIGGTFRRRWSLGAELGVGYLGGSGDIPFTSIESLVFGRVGARLERRFGDLFFLRGSAGFEWLEVSYSQAQVGSRDNVFDGDPLRGFYVGITAGLRGRHVGGFLRADVTRATTDRTAYTPLTISAGVDFAWF